MLVQDQRQQREEEEEACSILVGLSQGHSWKELGPSVWGLGQANKTEEGRREFILCGECVVEVFLGWAILPITLKPLLVGKREVVVLDDLGGAQLAHSVEEEVALGIVLGLGPWVFDPGQAPASHFPFGTGAYCHPFAPCHIPTLPSE